MIKITSTNAVVTLDAFYALHPTTTFPAVLSNAVLAGFDATLHNPPPDLPALKLVALAEIDKQLQALYNQSIVNAAIKDEYNAAYQSATAWIANQIAPVPPRVAALAAKFGITHLQAAMVVKTKTEEGNAKLEQRGAARLTAKAAIEGATTPAAVTAALQAGVAAMAAVVFTVT